MNISEIKQAIRACDLEAKDKKPKVAISDLVLMINHIEDLEKTSRELRNTLDVTHQKLTFITLQALRESKGQLLDKWL